MKKILILLVGVLSTLSVYSQTINISLDYAGLINEPTQGETTPVTDLEIGDEFYLDITLSNNSSNYIATYADIWFTFKNDAFEYLGIDNPNTNGNWYTNQWPSVYEFINSTTADVDDLYGQYYTDHRWNYVGEQSPHAPMVITSQTTGELTGVVGRLKFKYKQVPNGFDFTQSVILRKASVRDNVNGYSFTDIKAFPNQSFDNVPPSTTVTAQFKVLFPQTLDPTLFDGGLYTKDLNDTNGNSWIQPPFAQYGNLSSTGTLDITQGFNTTDEFAVIVNWDGYVVDSQNGDYVIPFSEQYSDIVTISDVALAFAELSNSGINQDEVGNEFNYGIQFMNGDVNGDGLFNSDDTYRLLLQVIEGTSYLENSEAMVTASKFYPKSQYDTITKENYGSIPNGGTLMNFLDNTTNSTLQYDFESAITWRGDINLSHSTEPDVVNVSTSARFVPSYAKAMNKEERQISTSLVTELVEGKVIVTITLDNGSQKVIGTQYKLGFDSSRLVFDDINFRTNNTSTNFSNLKGSNINIGSLIQLPNEFLDDTTTYTLTFTPTNELDNTLGLVTLLTTDAVNEIGEQLKMNIE